MKDDIRILGIAPYRFLPAVNGGHKAIEQFYRNVGSITKTIVVSTNNNDETFATNYRLIKLFTNSIFRYGNVLYFSKIKALLKQFKITHVILEHPYLGWLGAWLKKNTGITLIIHTHNIEAIRFKTINKWWWKPLWYYEKWTYQQADRVCFITAEDKDYAVNTMHLPENKCLITTFGTELHEAPSLSSKQQAKRVLQEQHHISQTNQILLFNGSFSYEPNLEALYHLLNTINPLLINKQTTNYTIIICGINIPQDVLESNFPNVIITGFVEDMNAYLLAADLFVCPVVTGGGIKTKLVEALAYDATCISYQSSAAGIDKTVCNGKLFIAEDNNAGQFVKLIQQGLQADVHIKEEFYEMYGARHIAEHLLDTLQNAVPQ